MGTTIKAAWIAGWALVQTVATAAVQAVTAAQTTLDNAVRRIPYVGAMLVLHGIRAGTLSVHVADTAVGPVLRVSVVGMPVGQRTLETTCGMEKNSGNKTALFYGAAVGYAFHVAGVGGRMTTDVAEMETLCARYGILTDKDFGMVNASVKAWLLTAHDEKHNLVPAKGCPARTVTAMRTAFTDGRATKASKDAAAEVANDEKAAKRHAAKAATATAKAAAKAANRLDEYVTSTSVARMTQDAKGVVAANRPTAVALMRILSDELTATAVPPVPAKASKASTAKVAA